MAGLAAVLFVALRRLENNPLPGWDHAVSTRHSVAVGVLLCVEGVAILASAKWGLNDGIHCVALMLTALMAARMLSRPIRDRTPAT
jgi:hypothetical protein